MHNKPNKKEVKDYLINLNPSEFQNIIKEFDKLHKTNFYTMSINDIDKKLLDAGVNSTCPYCGSKNFTKKGMTSKYQRFLCLSCEKSFNSTTNTILENSKFPWEVWVKILQLTINGTSIKDTINIINKDYGNTTITNSSVLFARHRLLHYISLIPQPTLSGVIQIDETFFRESQKGIKSKSNNNKGLINYIPTVQQYRKPRYGLQPSLLGVMGAEFANVPVAIDNTGHMVAKVACLGRLTIEAFTDLFHEHIINPTFICTDANPIYKRYCKLFSIPHYIRPSDYHNIIKKYGYDQPLYPYSELNKAISSENHKLLERLYQADAIDKIENKGKLTYNEFNNLKKTFGLNLANVNQIHKELKRKINKNKTSVATKYLSKYISFYTFLHNWNIDNGKYPTSFKDAEDILIFIIKNAPKTSFTLKDFQNTKLTLPKPSSKYIDLLAAMTSEARKEFNNKYLKFNEEDSVYNFKKREYLLDCPRSWISEVARQYGIPYRKTISSTKIVDDILKLPDIDIIMLRLILKEKQVHIAQEDADLLNYFKFDNISTDYNTPNDPLINKHYPPVNKDSPLYNPNAFIDPNVILDYSDGTDSEEDI